METTSTQETEADRAEALPHSTTSFTRLISTGIATKLITDTSFQIFNPFISIIGAGLLPTVVSEQARLTLMGQLLSIRNFAGMSAPVLGTVGDRVGYRRVARVGMLSVLAGLLLIGSSTGFLPALFAMLLLGIGHVAVTPMIQAYVSSQLPYNRRGRGIGMIEYSWALAGIVGLSLIGYIIQWSNWRVPFFLLAVGMAVMWFVFGFLPEVKSDSKQKPFNLLDIVKVDENRRSTYSTILAAGLFYFGAFQLMVVYGQWLVSDYGLQPIQLGTVAFGLGIADLFMGSVLVSLITDRIGKRISVITGVVISVIGYLLTIQLNYAVVPAVIGMAISRGAFEFAIVSSLSLLSEQTPRQRGKALTLGGATWNLSSVIGGFTAPWLFIHYGIEGVLITSTVCTLLSLVMLVLLVEEVKG